VGWHIRVPQSFLRLGGGPHTMEKLLMARKEGGYSWQRADAYMQM
jgi:hypothetical protein